MGDHCTDSKCSGCGDQCGKTKCIRCYCNICSSCRLDLSKFSRHKLKLFVREIDIDEFDNIYEEIHEDIHEDIHEVDYTEEDEDELNEKLLDKLLEVLKSRDEFVCESCHDTMNNICALCNENVDSVHLCMECFEHVCSACKGSFSKKCWQCICKTKRFQEYLLFKLSLDTPSDIIKDFQEYENSRSIRN